MQNVTGEVGVGLRECIMGNSKIENNLFLNTVKPLLSGHLRDLPKCPLSRGCPLNKGCKNCATFVNDQHSTATLYCDKVACCSRSYPEFKFITFHYQLSFVCKCKNIDRLQYVFQGRNPILLLSSQYVVRLTEVFNNRN